MFDMLLFIALQLSMLFRSFLPRFSRTSLFTTLFCNLKYIGYSYLLHLALTFHKNCLVFDDLSTKLVQGEGNHQQIHKLMKEIDFLSQLISLLHSVHCPSISLVSEVGESLQGPLTEMLFAQENSQHDICNDHCPQAVSS